MTATQALGASAPGGSLDTLHAATDAFLNTALIADPTTSWIAITLIRAVVGLLSLLAAYRLARMAMVAPLTATTGRWIVLQWLRTPWWRAPALVIATALVGLTLMLVLQMVASSRNPPHNFGQLTAYLIAMNGCLMGLALGVAWIAQRMRTFMISARVAAHD